MILKKPYAFLIKYFKFIHLGITLLSIYVLIKSVSIFSFFNQYIKNNYSVTSYEGFSSTYVSFLLFLVVFIIIGVLLLIVLMFENKKKPNKIYQVFFVYYLVFFVLLFVTKSILSSFEVNVIAAEIARVYRDISLIAIIPQIPIIIICAVRALGFNIKKFEFEKDMKELQITEEDNEEFEININHDGYKLKRTLRRFFREFKYYVKENKFIFACLCIVLVIIVGYLIVTNAPQKYNNSYRENQSFLYDGLVLNVKESMITNLDYNGNKLGNDYYLVLKINVSNNTDKEIEFKSKNLRLEVGDKYINPQYDKSSNFIDYANDFYGDSIMSKTSFDYALVYKINKSDIKNSFQIKIYRGSINDKKEIIDKFDYIKIKPDLKTEVYAEAISKVDDKVSFASSGFLDTTLKILSYEITEKYNYSYEYCVTTEDCRSFQDFVVVSHNDNNKKLIVLNYDFKLDENSAYSIRNKTISKFAENFMKVRYKDDFDEYQYSKAKNVTPKNLQDVLVLEIDDVVEKSSTYALSIIIREKEYLITLK